MQVVRDISNLEWMPCLVQKHTTPLEKDKGMDEQLKMLQPLSVAAIIPQLVEGRGECMQQPIMSGNSTTVSYL